MIGSPEVSKNRVLLLVSKGNMCHWKEDLLARDLQDSSTGKGRIGTRQPWIRTTRSTAGFKFLVHIWIKKTLSGFELA